ncbi:cytochrome P450 [Lentinus brumalis]|uniref:Cytochrome P450 n=1 Tax=Lentinus brumalis TaxID=2498619 RepID=A0A371CQ07_9APHY|nr:cytochrome P450 [Polyporus brumalis]
MLQASWAIVHQRPVRGDWAVLLLLAGFAVQYCLALSSEELRHHALSASIVLYRTYLLSLCGTTALYRLSPWHPLASYPGPWQARVTSLWLTCRSLRGQRYLLLDNLHRRYGPFVRIGPNILSINSASAIPLYVGMEKSETYRRHMRSPGFELFFKPAVTGQHRERKRIWAGLFTANGLSQLMPNLERRTLELMQCMERRQSQSERGLVDVKEVFSHWAFDYTTDVIFGGCNQFELMKKGDPCGLAVTGKIAFAAIDTLGTSPWIMELLWSLPVTPKRADTMLSLIGETVQKRLRLRPEFDDLVSYLLHASVDDEDIERDVYIAIVGGSDNIAVMTTLALYFLLAHPDYYQRLREELDAAFPDPTGSLPANDLAALSLLNGVINEALRLGTPFFLPRIVPKGGALLDNRFIPEDTIVALAAYSQQLSADNFFPEPAEFHPTRWLPDGLGPHTKTDKTVLASFTFGPYACIGKPLAYREMRHALARTVLTFDISLPPEFDVPAFRAGILNMHTTFFKHKLLVKVARRPGVKLESVYC